MPLHICRENLVERVSQTFKNHIKAGLASLDPDFPLSERDLLIEQSGLTLNLLRALRSNPKLPAQSFLSS